LEACHSIITFVRFLLAKLHIDSLGREDSRRGVKRALQGLPGELDGTYEEAMKRIQSQDPRKVRRAEQILSWICYAIRPMTVNEIQCALAVESGDTDIDEEALPDEDLLVSVCAGLVTIDRESNVIRFVHYTTREYFVDRFRTALTEIVRTCLTYLSFNKFADGYCRSDEEMEIRLRKYPLLRYASQYWGDHARGEPEQDQSIKDLIMQFLENEPKISCSIQLTHISKYRYEGYSQGFPKNVSGVELAATLGLEEITRKLLEKGSNVNRKDSDGGTALHWAAWGGHETVVRLLLEKGADVHAEYSSKATPLHWAAEGGHESLVRLLLEKGAHIFVEDVRKWTPMHRAAWNGYDAVVQLFLEKGVDINTRDSDGGTVLHGAAENGHEAVVRLLLDKGADVNSKDLDGGTPLHRAAWNGHKAVVRLLLEKKADVSAKYSYGGTAKRRRSSGQEVVVRLLLEKGADVAAKYFRGGTALHWAAWSGHEAVVRLLLDSGADFTAKDSDGGTALYGAAESGHEAVVQLLLEKWRELSIEDPGEDAETAVRRLLERGANSAVGEAGGPTALHWAAWDGREAAVRPLLDDGANINARNLNGRTALHWAAWSGHEAVVRLLLEMGADISIKDHGKWTALHWAAWNGHGAVVQLLLEKGADIATKDSDGKTAPDWADARGHKAVVQLLLENGASIAVEDTGSQDALVQRPLSKSSSTVTSGLQLAAQNSAVTPSLSTVSTSQSLCLLLTLLFISILACSSYISWN
jgi:ankyrin repeat protein